MTSVAVTDIEVRDAAEHPCRMRKKAAASEKASCVVPYGEPLNDAGTPLADFFRILLQWRRTSVWEDSHGD